MRTEAKDKLERAIDVFMSVILECERERILQAMKKRYAGRLALQTLEFVKWLEEGAKE